MPRQLWIEPHHLITADRDAAGSKAVALTKSKTSRSTFGRSGSMRSKTNFDDPSLPSCMMPTPAGTTTPHVLNRCLSDGGGTLRLASSACASFAKGLAGVRSRRSAQAPCGRGYPNERGSIAPVLLPNERRVARRGRSAAVETPLDYGNPLNELGDTGGPRPRKQPLVTTQALKEGRPRQHGLRPPRELQRQVDELSPNGGLIITQSHDLISRSGARKSLTSP
jgi:hypothetical protein